MKTHLLLAKFSTLLFLLLWSGDILAQEPTTPPSNLVFSGIDGNRMRLNYTSGNGEKHLIIAKEGSPVTATPSDGVDYVAGNFGAGNEIAPGEFVVYEGSSTIPFLNGLDHSTTYHFRIFEFNGSNTSTDYLTSSFLEGSQATLTNPTTQASNLTFSNVAGTSMSVNWTSGNGTGRILIAKAGSPVDVEPQQLVEYSNTSGGFGNSFYEIGTDNYVLSDFSGSSTNLTNLQPGVTYHFALFEYNGITGKVYLTTTSSPSIPGTTNSQTTATFPIENTTAVSAFNIIDGNRLRFGVFTKGNGARRIIVAKQGGAVMATPIDGIDYNASNTFGSGDELNVGDGEYVIYDGTDGNFQIVNNLQPNTTYHFKVFEYNGSGTNNFYLTGEDSNANPVFEISQATLNNPTTQASNITFSNVEGTSMTLNWDNGNGSGRLLIAKAGSPVDVEPQQLVEYSNTPGGFGNSFYEIGTDNYVLYDSTGSSTTISNLQPGVTYHFALFEYNGNAGKLYLTSSSTPNSAAPATGSQTTATAPTVNTTGGFIFSSINSNQMVLTYNTTSLFGNGARRIVVAKAGGPVLGTPVDGFDYTANATFGNGDTLNADEFVVFDGINPSFWIYGLQPNTTYHFKIFEYDGTDTNTSYLTGIDSNSNPVFEISQTTVGPPTVNSTGVFFNSKTNNSIDLNWTVGNGSGRILVAKEGSPVDAQPQDFIDYSASSNFGSGSEIGTGNYVIYDSSGNSDNVLNLNSGTNYHFEIFEFNGSGSGKVYLRPGYAFQEQTFGTTPTMQVSNPLFSVITSSSMVLDFDKGDGSHRLVLAKKDSPVDVTPSDLTSYSASNLFGNGDEIGTGNFVVFSNTGEEFQLTNLDPTSTYHFAFFEYALSQNGDLYLTPGLTASQTTASLPCQIASNLNVTNITNTSATLSWNAEPSALNGFDYVLNTDGTVPDGITTPTGSVLAGTNNVDLIDLFPNTEYFFFVRSDCDDTQSQWSNFQNFTTLCDDPIAIAQNITVQLDANGEVTITPEQIDDDSLSNCGSSSLSLDVSYFDCSNIGVNTVTLTVTDVNDVVDTTTAAVTVEDATPPSVITQNITVQLDSSGQASIVASDINNGSTDNCAIDDLSLNIMSFDCSNVGVNTVILTATDVNDNSSSATAIVTVEDVTPPAVVTKDITVQLGSDGTVTITPEQVDSDSTDDCGIENLSLDNSTFTTANIGANIVTLTVTDVGGNSVSDTAVVTVQDTDLPVVITQDITVQLDINGQVTITPEDIDNGSTTCCGNTSLSLDTTFFDCANIGSNTVTLTVSDGVGNSESATAIVTVEDNLNPIAIVQDLTVEIDENGNGSLTANMVDNGSSDNCEIASISIDKMTFSCSDIGVEVVTLTVTDVNGNASTATANVTVEDQNPPNIWFADNDMDGFGDDDNTLIQCSQPAGYVPVAGDCNDSDADLYPGAQSFGFTGNTGFVDTVVSPLIGAPTDTYTFEVEYFDVNNEMPAFGFPRAIVDYNSDGNFTGQFDRTIILTPLDSDDTDLTDGKIYIGSISPLEVHQNYEVLVETFIQGCETQFGPFSGPDVLEQPDVEIFASDISFSENNPEVNSPLTVFAEVHNVSDLPAENFFVGLENQVDDTVYPDIFIDVIPPNSSVIVDWPITTPAEDAFVPMRVIIDKTDVIAESNELDNTAIRPYINGDYNVPGSIDVVTSVSPSSGFTFTKYFISGNATYSDLAVELEDQSVMGAEVSIFVPGLGQTFIGYTNNAGNFSIGVPNGTFIAPGVYTYQGVVTDFTLQTEFSGQFTVVAPPILPDLVASASFSPNTVIDNGNPVSSLLIIVSNVGTEDVLVNTNLSIAQSPGFTDLPANVTIPPLQAGQSHQISFTNLQFDSTGSFSVSIQADSNNIITNEVSENNNFGFANINVLPAGPDLIYQGGPFGNKFLCQDTGQDIGFTLRNVGTVATSNDFTCTISVSKDGDFIDTYQAMFSGVIVPNGFGSVSIPNVYNDTGNYTFSIEVDSLDEVAELNETNNLGSASINILECQPDLLVSLCQDDLIVSPEDPLDSANVTYTAEIFNSGIIATADSFTVLFQVDGPGGTFNYPTVVNTPIGINSSIIVSVAAPLAANDSELTVIVDSNADIDEAAESNNEISINLCHEFSLAKPPPIVAQNDPFWQDDVFFQFQNVTPNINLVADFAYTASEVDVKFEVTLPSGVIVDLGTVTVDDVDGCDLPTNVELPTSFSFNDLGSHVFTMTVDPDNEYLECDDTNNIYIRDVEVESLADMRTLSEFINPSVLNPAVNELVNLDITYENIGSQNVSDVMDFKVFVNEVEISTITNVPGLLNGDNNTIQVPVQFQSNVPGANVVKVFIDSGDDIMELREDNNEATRVIIVGDASNLYFEDFAAAYNMVAATGNNTQLQATVGNDGILDSEALLRFTYFTPDGTEVFIGQLPIQVTAGSTSSYSLNWAALNPSVILKAEILNSTIPEFNELDNIITLENKVDFSLQNPNPLNLIGSGGDNVDVEVDVSAMFNIVPFAINDVQVSAYLSTDCELDEADQFLNSVQVDFAVGVSNITQSLNIDIPVDVSNNSRIIWVVDENEQFEELNEENNQLCITVNSDNTVAPNVITQDAVVELDANGQASITVDDIDNGSTDDVTPTEELLRSLDSTTFDCGDIGMNTVTLTVTDSNGNSSSETAMVTVVDNINPNAVTQDISVSLNAIGQANISVQDIDEGSFDNCTIVSSMLDITSFDCEDIGENIVTLTVTDSSGNVDTAIATVTVVDDIDPNAVAQDLTVTLGAGGTVTIMPSQLNGDSTDNCEIASFSLDQMTFDSSDIGTNTVILTVTDSSGNQDTDSAVVTVQVGDTNFPIAITQDITVQLDANGQASITPAMVDNDSTTEAGLLNLSLDITDFDCSNLGLNTVTLTITDVNNDSDSAEATVTVEDNVNPVAFAQNITVQLDFDMVTIVPSQIDNGSTDNCGIASSVLDVTAFDCSNLGANIVTLTVTDTSGNMDTATAIVTVEDVIAPTIISQDITVFLDSNGEASITGIMLDGGSTDNCSIVSYDVNVSSFDCSNLGPNTVEFTVTDASGYSATYYEVEVTVEDNINPEALSQNITVQLAANGTVTISPSQVDNGSTDNCGIASTSLDIFSFTSADIGANTVILTVIDASGNANSATAVVTVEAGTDLVTAVTQDISVQLDANGEATITPAMVDEGSSVVTGTPILSLNVTDFDCSNLGATTVTLTVSDANGNVDTATATVTVVDEIEPVVTTQDITIQLNSLGMASITAAMLDDGSSDNCGIASYSLDQSAFTTSDLGLNTVTLTATDASDNFASSTAIVTVLDAGTGPTLAFQEMFTVPIASLSSSVAFNDVDGDNDQDFIITGSTQRNQFGPSGGQTSRLYKNNGQGNFNQVNGTPFIGLSYSSLSFSDVNFDGTQDVISFGEDYTTGISHLKYYANDGLGNFTETTGTPFPNMKRIDFKIADFDNNGVKDVLFIGLGGNGNPNIRLFENTGTEMSPNYFNQFNPSPIPAVRKGSIAIADVDGDNDLDIFISGELANGTKIARLYRNNGNFQFSQVMGTPFDAVDSGDSAFADVDDDGDQDLLISGLDSNDDNVLKLYLNDGTGSVFTEAVDAIDISSVFLLEAFDFGDIDGDGDFDVLFTGYNTSNLSRVTTIWENLLYSPSTSTRPSEDSPNFNINFEEDEVVFGNNFKVFPNPTDKGYFTIYTPDLEGEVSIRLSDAFGRQVISKKMLIMDNQLSVNVDGFSAGVYVVMLRKGNLTYKTKLIVE